MSDMKKITREKARTILTEKSVSKKELNERYNLEFDLTVIRG